jgi:hypothetical protein
MSTICLNFHLLFIYFSMFLFTFTIVTMLWIFVLNDSNFYKIATPSFKWRKLEEQEEMKDDTFRTKIKS